MTLLKMYLFRDDFLTFTLDELQINKESNKDGT